MAIVPLSGTNIRLLSGVPFSNDYKHTRWFDTKSEQTSYFTGKNVIHSISEANFQRIEGHHFIAVNKSIDELWATNYLMFQNTAYNSKWFYAFVTKLEYVQKKTTYVHFQIDVFQTWKFEMDFKPSFVIREHCKLWNSDGTPVINTIDEGLNYGTEYDTVTSYHYEPNGGYKWLVCVTKEPIHKGADSKITPVVVGTAQPLSYYIHPFKDTDLTPLVRLDGATTEGSPMTKLTTYLQVLYSNEEATNNVVSLFVTDYTGLPCTFIAGVDNGPDILTFQDNSTVLDVVAIDGANSVGADINTLYVKKVYNFLPHTKIMFSDKYSDYASVKESKLLMYPYVMTVLDDFKGNRAVYKNEYLDSNNFEIQMRGSLGLSNKISYSVPKYNHDANNSQNVITSHENAIINNNPNDLPIITDLLTAYLQGNRNSLENQKNSIIFNGVMDAVGGSIAGVASASQGSLAGTMASATSVGQGLGNTQLQLQAMEAKQKDIGNIPPHITKMGSNTAFDFGNNHNGVYAIKKQIKPEYRKKLEQYFNMFGYKVHEVKVPNFHTRSKWNYVQTQSCNILGDFNNEDLKELKAVFDNGITFWHTDDVGNYSLENGVI